MPFIQRLIWSCLVCLPPAVLAEPTSQLSLRNQCSDAFFSQVEVKACLEKASSASLQALAQAEQRMVHALNHWDQEPHHIHQARLQLTASQKAFVLYRDQQCKLLSAIGGGATGNTYLIRKLACTTELNQRRTAQLLETVAELPSK